MVASSKDQHRRNVVIARRSLPGPAGGRCNRRRFTTSPRAKVTLDGTSSTGAILSYTWTRPHPDMTFTTTPQQLPRNHHQYVPVGS